jgi:hypothetical protein
LAPLDPPVGGVGHRALAGSAPRGTLPDDCVGRRRQRHAVAGLARLARLAGLAGLARLAGLAGLAPGLPARLLTQTLGRARQALTRGWLGAVVALFGQSPLERLHFSPQLVNLLVQSSNLGTHDDVFFLGCHATSLSGSTTPS